MDLRQGILSTASALGVNPLDLATAISYETAGTFDPTKRGPTTQWGQHRGLIQFGEPQAKRYGVNWDDPIGSQLGPQGAVANYLRDTGVKPGMGLLDIYSAINAGGVGRYNASDANNGGAPGTVRDKVERQMAGHRAKAQALLQGGGGQDTAVGGLSMTPQSPPDRLRSAPMQQQPQQQRQHMLFKNMDPNTRDRLIMAMQGMTMNPNQGLMQMAQQNMQDRRDTAKKNKTMAWLASQPGGEQFAQAIAAGVPAGQAYSAYLAHQQKQASAGQPDYVYQDGQWWDKNNPQAGPVQMPGGQQGQPTLTKDQFGTLDKISDDARSDLAPAEEVRASWERIRELSTGGGTNDVALVAAFAKLLDPGSVVREGEAATIANSGSIPASMRSALLNALNGSGTLPPQVRTDILNIGQRIYEQTASQARNTIGAYEERAQRAGIGGEDIYPGSDFAAPLSPLQTPRPPARQGAQATPAAKAAVQQAISRLSPMDRQVFDALQTPREKAQFLKQRGLIGGQ